MKLGSSCHSSTKKCNTHAELSFCQSKPIAFLPFSLTSPTSLLMISSLPSKKNISMTLAIAQLSSEHHSSCEQAHWICFAWGTWRKKKTTWGRNGKVSKVRIEILISRQTRFLSFVRGYESSSQVKSRRSHQYKTTKYKCTKKIKAKWNVKTKKKLWFDYFFSEFVGTDSCLQTYYTGIKINENQHIWLWCHNFCECHVISLNIFKTQPAIYNNF